MVETRGRESALASLVPGLASVESRLGELFGPAGGRGADLASHVIGAGGKRLRPALVLASAGGRSPVDPDRALVDTAAALELIHTASLIHDDIMDGASHRRGVATLHHMWGPHTSVLAGDYLFARSFSLLAGSGNPAMVEMVADSVSAMCEGQIDETLTLGDPDVTEAQYMLRIERKTAGLVAASCVAGGLQAGLGAGETRALREYGLNLGLAFQLADDIMDVDGDPASMGKPAGSDLSGGVVTLPLIHIMSKPRFSWVRDQIRTAAAEVGSVLDAMRWGGGIEYTRSRVRRHTRLALRALGGVSDHCSYGILSRLAGHLSGRWA